mmetsp:Transcript_13803/g.33412  ORF Transcript_13803/g.33412 Transcript_13803/m.33412 type:complete len:277 (+) Transcript_13803:276-1106(+)
MTKSARGKRSLPPAAPSSPSSHMLINSILIQTDDGRRFDSSIQYNRIIDDPFRRRKNSHSLKPILAIMVTIAVVSYLLISENMGFSSLPLVVTDRKYLGRKPNIGNTTDDDDKSLSRRTSNDVAIPLTVNDDDIDDELIGTDDGFNANPSFESTENNPGQDNNDRFGGSGYGNTTDIDNGADFSIDHMEGNETVGPNDRYEGKDIDNARVIDGRYFYNNETKGNSHSNVGLGGRENEDVDDIIMLNGTESNQSSDNEIFRVAEDGNITDADDEASY